MFILCFCQFNSSSKVSKMMTQIKLQLFYSFTSCFVYVDIHLCAVLTISVILQHTISTLSLIIKQFFIQVKTYFNLIIFTSLQHVDGQHST